MPIHELAALGAAALWAYGGIIAATPAAHLGAIAFTRLRMVMVFVMLITAVSLGPGWSSLGYDHISLLTLSGLVGIFLGDTALFLTMNRMGPRRTAMLFSLNAPISAALGWLLLGEELSSKILTGMAICFAGVMLSIVFGKRRSQLHSWESVKGPLWIGLLLGLLAALCQSGGSLLARPVMETGVDPVAASTVRIGIAAAGLVCLGALPFPYMRAIKPLNLRIAGLTALCSVLGMGVGMTLILFALSGGKVGIISTLSATTPALQLPLLWWRTGEMPAPGAWIGAALVVFGCALMFAV